MFLSDEWNACVYNAKPDGQAIAQLMRHVEFLDGSARGVPLANLW
jgi:hypothetical protein